MAVDADGNPVADDDDIRQLYPGQKENRETLPYRDLKKKACVHCSSSSSHFRWGRKWNIPKVNISYSTLMYWLVVEDLSKTLEHSIRYPLKFGPTPHGTERKNPAKIGGRNSSFASFDLGVGVRLRTRCSQPDAKARRRGRNTRITPPDFRRVFSCSGWVSYKPHRKRDELFMFYKSESKKMIYFRWF